MECSELASNSTSSPGQPTSPAPTTTTDPTLMLETSTILSQEGEEKDFKENEDISQGSIGTEASVNLAEGRSLDTG